MSFISYINNTASSFPIYVIIITLLSGIIFRDVRGIIFFLLLIFNVLLNLLLKFLMKDRKESKRPKNEPGDCGDPYGMPSGHSQFVWFFSFFIILYIFFNNNYKDKLLNTMLILSLSLISIIISISRIYINCHTTKQVIVGGIFGIILAIIFFISLKKYFITANSSY